MKNTTKTCRGPVTFIQVDDVNAGYSQSQLHISDLHWDSIYCDREALFTDLDKAKKENARIFMYGDVFDAMQGRFDPRRSMDELRPEFRTDAYFDAVVDDFTKALIPYVDNIEMIAQGNHETAIIKNSGISLLDRLVYRLNREHGGDVTLGGYGGWVVWNFSVNGRNTSAVRLKYFHGAGGDAPVTRGAIHTSRQAVYLPDADIVVNGHNHNSYHIPIARERVTPQGLQYFDIQHHLRVPGYKNAYGDGSKGWEVTRGGVPKPIGCGWTTMALSFERKTAAHSGFMKIKVESDVRGATVMESVEGLYEGPVYPEE